MKKSQSTLAIVGIVAVFLVLIIVGVMYKNRSSIKTITETNTIINNNEIIREQNTTNNKTIIKENTNVVVVRVPINTTGNISRNFSV